VDADTTGAICAQLAGAFYGARAIDGAWVAAMHRWAGDEVELRAIALFSLYL
jgi:ADP-ribosylglycohydrolase